MIKAFARAETFMIELIQLYMVDMMITPISNAISSDKKENPHRETHLGDAIAEILEREGQLEALEP